ncbi:MAG: hypothetical protein R2941_04765 [Desulfobacterales bacterium]
MLPAKQDLIRMIDHLPEQQLQKVINYIILITKEKYDETMQPEDQQVFPDPLNGTVDAKRMDFNDAQLEVYHDLDMLAGTWTDEETQEFLTAIADFSQVDETLWE